MRANPLKETLEAGGTVFGSFVSLPEPGIVEAIGYAGYDFVIIDMEHSPIDFGDLRCLLAAADGAGVAPLVRVGTPEANPILRVLDTGALGVMVPHVRSAEDARAVVSACRYFPDGKRGVNSATRAAGYGLADFGTHVQESNEEILTIALIEDPEGVDDIAAITGVPGLDIVCPGPGDLSAALGLPGQSQHPTVQAAVQQVVEAVNAEPGLVLGYHIMGPPQLPRAQELGARFVIMSQDTRVLFAAYRDALIAMRPEVAHSG